MSNLKMPKCGEEFFTHKFTQFAWSKIFTTCACRLPSVKTFMSAVFGHKLSLYDEFNRSKSCSFCEKNVTKTVNILACVRFSIYINLNIDLKRQNARSN